MKIGRALQAGVSTLALTWTVPTWAQASASPTASVAAAPAVDDGEIIVTAQKRSERLNDVPISITAATGEQLAKQGITSPEQLDKIVPGLTFQKSPYGNPVFTIRGVGFYDNSIGGAPAVSVYLDQVPLPLAEMTRGVSLDIERIEVLKGPQGTLFGQATTGGAVNYIAAKPTEELSAGGELEYGRFNAVKASAFVSGELAPNLTARIAGRYEYADGWQKQFLPQNARFGATAGDRNGDRRFFTGRGILDWKPSDKVRFELSVSGWQDRSETQAERFIAFTPQTAINPFNAPTYAAFAGLTEPPRDPRLAGFDVGRDLSRRDHFYQVALNAAFDLGDFATLTSISAYSRYKEFSPGDLDGTAFLDFGIQRFGDVDSYSQELRLAGDAGRFRWMIGGNYAYDRIDETQTPLLGGTNAGIGPFRYTSVNTIDNQKVHTYAGFGSLDFKITDQLTVQGSARYTKQNRDFEGCLGDSGNGEAAAAFSFLYAVEGFPGTVRTAGQCLTQTAPGTVPPIIKAKLDQDNVSFRGSINYKPSVDTLLYASIAKGYKPGSFSNLPGIFANQYAPAVQESVLTYESGFKASLADRRVQLSAAAFYYDYRDKQLLGSVNVGPPFGNLPTLVNVPKSRAYGAEIEATVRPFEGLRFSGGVTYVNSKVRRDPVNPIDAFGNATSFIGEAFPNTPKWIAVGDAEYRFGFWGEKHAFLGGGFVTHSHTYALFGELPQLKIDGYTIVDVRAGIEGANDRWRVQLFGRNVSNKFYYTNIQHGVDAVAGFTGAPATYGVQLAFRY